MIAVIDYGMGNLRSVEKAFQKLGYAASITDDKTTIEKASAIVLPGVGSFADGMSGLVSKGLDETITSQVTDGKPFLGICLGLQLLFEVSDEGAGSTRGLGLVKGRVSRLPGGVKVPHIGWNQITFRDDAFFEGIPQEAQCYFDHSFFVVPEEKSCIASMTEYGSGFASSVRLGNIIATQFHPEKSSSLGLRMLDNFASSAGVMR